MYVTLVYFGKKTFLHSKFQSYHQVLEVPFEEHHGPLELTCRREVIGIFWLSDGAQN